MARVARFLSLAIAITALPSCLAGPASCRKHFKTSGCPTKCGSKWGWHGKQMGNDRWGNVIKNVDINASMDVTISKACGLGATAGGAITTQPAGNTQTNSTASTSVVPSSPTPVSSGFISNITSSFSTATKPGFTPVPQASSTKLVTKTSTSSGAATSTTKASTTSAIRPPPVQTTSTTSARQTPMTTTKAPVQTSVPTNGSPGGTSGGDIQAYLSAHNSVRAAHGASPLTWSDDLAAKAQQWANGCVFEHSGGKLGRFGENLAAGTGGGYNIQAAIKSWTDEVADYDPGNPQPSHFTQVVWKGTTQLGCAVQSCDGIFAASFGKAKYYVCEYSPAGNVIGQFAQNVQA